MCIGSQFFRDMTNRSNCPEWAGYNTQNMREANAGIGRKCKSLYIHLINKTPATLATMKLALKRGLKVVQDGKRMARLT